MNTTLQGRRALVTGGTKGIGRAISLGLARAGARVVACYRQDHETAAATAKELDAIGDGHRVVAADITRPEEADRLLADVAGTLGGLDVLVNNTGVDGVVHFDDLGPDEWHRVMDHNVTSVYAVTHAAADLLADDASVIVVGSSVALRGRARGVHYSTSKAALVGFTKALSKDLGGRGIRVNLVSPGLTETEPGAGLPPEVIARITSVTALGRIAAPEDVAAPVLFLAGDGARHITGTTITVDGGI